MDISAIATTAITTLTALLANGGEGIANGIGNDLWAIIKKPFTRDQDDTAILAKFKENPNDQENRGAVKFQLQNFLKEHHEMARQIQELLSKPEMKDAVKQINISKNISSIANSTIISGGSTNFNSNNTESRN